MRLNVLLKGLKIENNPILDNIEISGVSYHSQKVEEGHLFVCIKGYKTDGHQYLADAVKSGAVLAVVEELQEHIDIPQFVVKDSRKALAVLGSNFYHHPSDKLTMIGVTATNGKTTTSYMIDAILDKEIFRTGLIGTVSIKNGDTSIPSELTTPESLDLQYYLNEMVNNDVSHVTMEVSSSALELNRVHQVNYDIVTLNNISLEHIDAHGSFERYFEVKSSLIRNASEDSTAVLNLDDKYSASLVNKTNANVITFGIDHTDGHIVCKNLDLSTGRAKFTFEIQKSFEANHLKFSPTTFDVELSVPGLHSVYNAMVAIIVGLINGIPATSIQQSILEFKGVPRRFEFIYEDTFKIVDDHFANPGNIDVTMQTLTAMDYEKLHLVYGIRGQRGPQINQENADAIVKWAADLDLQEVIATRSSSHTTAKDVVTDAEVQAFVDTMTKANIQVKLYDELPDAIKLALKQAKENDLVLLAGCQGMDQAAEVVADLMND